MRLCHPVSERVAAWYHFWIGIATVAGVLYHLEAFRRHWRNRER